MADQPFPVDEIAQKRIFNQVLAEMEAFFRVGTPDAHARLTEEFNKRFDLWVDVQVRHPPLKAKIDAFRLAIRSLDPGKSADPRLDHTKHSFAIMLEDAQLQAQGRDGNLSHLATMFVRHDVKWFVPLMTKGRSEAA